VSGARAWLDALSHGDRPVMAGMLAPDVVLWADGARLTGREAVMQWLVEVPHLPETARVDIDRLDDAEHLAVASFSVRIPLASGGARIEQALVAVTADATGVRRIVVDPEA
jgi:hypothetical protein